MVDTKQNWPECKGAVGTCDERGCRMWLETNECAAVASEPHTVAQIAKKTGTKTRRWIQRQTARALRKLREREEWVRTAPQPERAGECTCCARSGRPRPGGEGEVLCDEHDRERREGRAVQWGEVRGTTRAHARVVLAELCDGSRELPARVVTAASEYMAHEGGASEQQAYRELMRAVSDAWPVEQDEPVVGDAGRYVLHANVPE